MSRQSAVWIDMERAQTRTAQDPAGLTQDAVLKAYNSAAGELLQQGKVPVMVEVRVWPAAPKAGA